MAVREVAQPGINPTSLWVRILALTTVFTAGVSAPLLDLYGRNPEVFVANRTTPVQMVLFALVFVLGVPALTAGLLALARLVGSRTEAVAFWTFGALWSLAVGLATSRQLVPDSTAGALAVALTVAAVSLLLIARMDRTAALLSPAAIAVLVLFLGFSPSAPLIWEEPEVDGSSTVPIEEPGSILFIQLDELPLASLMTPVGDINGNLFPAFARLAQQGTWYRNGLSASIATSQGVPATLTGNLGGEGLSPSVVDHPNNLFTLLGPAFEMHVIEWTAELCPEELCEDFAGRDPVRFASILGDAAVVYGHLTLPSAFRSELPSIENAWKGFLGQGRVEAGSVDVEGFDLPPSGDRARWIDWLERLGQGFSAGEPPTLHYAHVESPHVPWQVNPTGTHYERPEKYTEVDGVEGTGFWIGNPSFARLGLQRHLYQLGFLDSMLGTLFDRLDVTGLWDDAMVVVTSDHGASFTPSEHRRWPYDNNRADLYRVPLFVKYPDQETGEIRDEPAFAIDIVPTVVDVMGIQTDWQFDGVSLRSIEGTDREHEIIHWCCSTEGASTDLAELFAQVRRNYEWIPDQTSWLGVAAAGPFGDFVGRPLEGIETQFSSELRWALDYQEELVDVERDSGRVQTLVTGRVVLPADAVSDEILVVVNGVVAGTGFVTRDTAEGGPLRALLAEELVVDGFNDVALLARTGDGWVVGSPDDVALELIADDGHVIELQDEGNRRVQVDRVLATPNGWTVTGWAADVRAKETPDFVYVFVGDKLVASGPPNLENENVVGWFNSDDLLMSGFRFDVAADAVPAGVEYIIVVAEFGDYAIGDPVALTR